MLLAPVEMSQRQRLKTQLALPPEEGKEKLHNLMRLRFPNSTASVVQNDNPGLVK